MNKIILMIGSIMFLYLFFLLVFPSYDKFIKKNEWDRGRYNLMLNVVAIFLSLMINFLTWGWFI